MKVADFPKHIRLLFLIHYQTKGKLFRSTDLLMLMIQFGGSRDDTIQELFILLNDDLVNVTGDFTKDPAELIKVSLTSRGLLIIRDLLDDRESWPVVEIKDQTVDEKNSNKSLGGRPTKREEDEEEFVYRLAKAKEANELKNKDSSATWGEIAKTISWSYGYTKAGLATLRRARKDLKELDPDDPILEKVREYRESQATKTT